MQTTELEIKFLTPAFLGDADQTGAWRAPPFKAQLRQWWRVVAAPQHSNWKALCEAEGKLFGDAAGGGGQKSLVRLRLDRWRSGQMVGEWPKLGKVGDHGKGIDSGLYLGFGPIGFGPKLNKPPAIGAGERATLRLACPLETMPALQATLVLMHRFGSVGGRSRNAWGSFVLGGEGLDSLPLDWSDYLIDWREALEVAWVRGIGRDETGPLVWQTQRVCADWQHAMAALAGIRHHVNRAASPRRLLSHPVTQSKDHTWAKDARLPNSLRLKVVQDDDGKLRGQVAHFPCGLPKELRVRREDEQALRRLWPTVHRALDGYGELQRVGA